MNKLSHEQKELVQKAVREKTVKNRISCHQARAIASELQLSIRNIGEVIDEMGVRISQCELGCF